MSFSQKIKLLIYAINSENGVDEDLKKRKIDLMGKLIGTANKYIEIVVRQSFLLQINEGTKNQNVLEELANLDKSRSRIHDSLIGQIAIVNRLCEEYELELIYTGGEARRDKGDFALELVSDYFKDRI